MHRVCPARRRRGVVAGVVEVEKTVRGEAGMEAHRLQPVVARQIDFARDVEIHRAVRRGEVGDDGNHARALDNEEPVRLARCRDDGHRAVEGHAGERVVELVTEGGRRGRHVQGRVRHALERQRPGHADAEQREREAAAKAQGRAGEGALEFRHRAQSHRLRPGRS